MFLWTVVCRILAKVYFFFFNDTATTEIYTLSLHDALPISRTRTAGSSASCSGRGRRQGRSSFRPPRSEEHTSELQSQSNLVCRLLLEKKKTTNIHTAPLPPTPSTVPTTSRLPRAAFQHSYL